MRFIQIESFNISVFQLKNSNIRSIQENIIIQIYQRSDFKWIYIDNIYNIENNIKNKTEYIIDSGKIGTWYGIGVNGWVYNNSIQKWVSLQNTCHQKNAQIYPINNTKINDITNGSIYLLILSLFIFVCITKTKIKPNNAHISEKL